MLWQVIMDSSLKQPALLWGWQKCRSPYHIPSGGSTNGRSRSQLALASSVHSTEITQHALASSVQSPENTSMQAKAVHVVPHCGHQKP